MYLAIDIGNSRTKVAVYENNTLIQLYLVAQENQIKEIEKILESWPTITQTLITSVGKNASELFSWIQKKTPTYLISAETKMPFINQYATPYTLGTDRAILVAGACLKYPNQNCLIIDAGSCITYDFLTEQSIYLGGAISPGFSLRYKSLHDYTAKLPLLSIEENHPLIGNSTQSSIQSGVINGILFEIEGIIQQYKESHKTLTIILTGGDSIFLAKRLKNSIFAQPNFILESLILHHQYICK